MDKEKLFKHLDLSGGEKSWFDLWHTHADWKGDGNNDWLTREKFIGELVDFYMDLKSKMKDFPRDYQLFILIIEEDSSQDSVYIHSKNPNDDNFPLKITKAENFVVKDRKLKNYIDSLAFTVIPFIYDNEQQYYLYDNKAGIPLTG